MKRKEIIKALEEHFGIKPKYLGMPSCSYELTTNQQTYTIDVEGKITTLEGKQVELESLISTTCVEEVAAEPIKQETISFEVAFPLVDHTGTTLKNLVNMIYSKQALIKKSFGVETNIIEDTFSVGINAAKIETITDFKAAIEGLGSESCPGIRFDFDNNTITFKFSEGNMSSELLKAYTQLVTLLNQNALTLKYASPKVNETDNEKFSFRVWLVKLGMIGNEYKTARKILLERLEGNAVYKNGTNPKKVAVE